MSDSGLWERLVNLTMSSDAVCVNYTMSLHSTS